METSKPLHDRELSRLAEELADDAGLQGLSEEELEEILYATRPPIHEGRIPSYGAFIRTSRAVGGGPANPATTPLRVRVTDLGQGRMLADGRTSFVLRTSATRSLVRIYPAPIGDELSLVHRARGGHTIIQRTAAGQVRIFRRNRIVLRDAASRWSSKPTSSLYLNAVAPHVRRQSQPVAGAVLDLCVHQLGAARVGATIVQPLTARPLEHLDRSEEFRIAKLDVTDARTHPALRVLLSQLDRAAILDPGGSLESVNVTLTGDGVASTSGGTRHHSAAAFSASEPECVVYVVSSDGPVTVYSGGQEIANPERFLDVEASNDLCPECGYEEDTDSDDPFVLSEYRSNDPSCETCGGTGHLITIIHVQRRYRYEGPFARRHLSHG